jgi:hypothetical protein
MNAWLMMAAVVAVATVIAELIAGPYGYFHWHFIPAFDLVYGFLGCVAIILISKAAGKWFIQRPESYTPEGDRPRDDRDAGKWPA